MTSTTRGVPYNVRKDVVHHVLKDLRKISGTGDTLLLVVGAHAASTHIRGFRTTQDVDFLMSFRGDIEPIGKALSSTFPAKYRYETKDREIFYLWDNSIQVAIDMIPFGAFEERMPVLGECRKLSRLNEGEVPIASLPDLLILKMSALCDSDRQKGAKQRVDIFDTFTFISSIRVNHLSLPSRYSKWIFKELKTNTYPPEVASQLWGLIPYNKNYKIEEVSDEEEEYYDDDELL